MENLEGGWSQNHPGKGGTKNGQIILLLKKITTMKNLFSLIILFFFTAMISFSQVTIGANNTPDPSAVLDLQSQNKGFLMPRLTTAQRNAIVSPAIGLEIYNTTTNCWQIYLPQSTWKDVSCDCQSSPSSAFTFPNAISQGAPAAFVATSPGLTYSWTFQSGTPATSTQQTENVTWVVAGSYTVSLTVTDNNGCSSTTTQTITVVNCVTGGSFTFSNCGATGKTGPIQPQCDAIYGSGVVISNGGVQEWPVPPGVCSIDIEVWGAQGGSTTGGLGAYMKGTFAVTPGETLHVVVGQRGLGSNSIWASGGGGGGSFVWSSANPANPLIIAGGGGGGNINYSPCGLGTPGLTGTNGDAGVNGASGGTNGNGGSGTAPSGAGSGGAGWLTPGGNSSYGGGCTGGTSQYSFLGGDGYSGVSAADGGFGGGGGSVCGCGGGGGYSGGGGGEGNACCSGGGGGGSFNAGSNQASQAGVRAGHGEVIISW